MSIYGGAFQQCWVHFWSKITKSRPDPNIHITQKWLLLLLLMPLHFYVVYACRCFSVAFFLLAEEVAVVMRKREGYNVRIGSTDFEIARNIVLCID